jgi:hypothetical protein
VTSGFALLRLVLAGWTQSDRSGYKVTARLRTLLGRQDDRAAAEMAARPQQPHNAAARFRPQPKG